MDSISAKAQQLQTSIQSLYTEGGFEDIYKGVLDSANNVLTYLNGLPKLFGKIPLAAVSVFVQIFAGLKGMVTSVFASLVAEVTKKASEIEAKQNEAANKGSQERINIEGQSTAGKNEAYTRDVNNFQAAEARKTQIAQEQAQARTQAANQQSQSQSTGGQGDQPWASGKTRRERRLEREAQATEGTTSEQTSATEQKVSFKEKHAATIQKAASAAIGIGTALQFASMAMEKTTDGAASLTGLLNAAGSLASTIGYALSGNIPMAILTAISGVIQGLDNFIEDKEEKIERLENDVTNTRNEKLQSKDELKTLTDYKKKYDELAKSQNKNAEAHKEFQDLQNEIASKYPELIQRMDSEGNYVVDMATAYDRLAEAKAAAYKADFIANADAELAGLNDIDYILSSIYGQNPLEGMTGLAAFFNNTDDFGDMVVARQRDPNYDLTKEYTKRMDVGTATRLFDVDSLLEAGFFGSDSEGHINYSDRFNKLFGNFRDTQYDDQLGEVAAAYHQAAADGLSFYEAQAKVTAEFTDIPGEILSSYNSDMYNYLQKAESAVKFQEELQKNKISELNGEYLNYLQSFTGIDANELQFAAMTRQMDEAWEQYQIDHENDMVSVSEQGASGEQVTRRRKINADEMYKNFIEQYDTTWYNNMVGHNGELEELQDEELNALYQTSGQYSLDKYKAKLKELGVVDDPNKNDDVWDQMIAQYGEDYNDTIEYFNSGISEMFGGYIEQFKSWLDDVRQFYTRGNSDIDLDSMMQEVQNYANSFGPPILAGIQEQYEQIFNNKDISEDQRLNQLQGLTDVYDQIEQIADPDDLASVANVMASADTTSLFGIYSAIGELQDLDLSEGTDTAAIQDNIKHLGTTLQLNVEAEIQAYEAALSGGMEDFEKTAQNAVKGMDFKSATELAGKLGITLNDFEFKDGQFFFGDYQLMREKILQENQDYINALREQAEAQGVEFDEEEALKPINDYANYISAQMLLQQDKAEEFVAMVMSDAGAEDVGAMAELVRAGDIEALGPQFAHYGQLITQTYNDINKSIYEQVISGLGQDTFIEKTDANARTMDALAEAGVVTALIDDKTNEVYGYIVNGLEEGITGLYDTILASDLPEATKIDLMAKAHEQENQFNAPEALDAVVDSYDAFDYKEGLNLLESLGIPLEEINNLFMEDYAGNLVSTVEQMRGLVTNAYKEGRISLQDFNSAMAAIDAREAELDPSILVADFINSRDSISEEEIATLATSLGKTRDEIIALLHDNGDGTYSADIGAITAILQMLGEVPENVQNALLSQLEGLFDGITNAFDLFGSGTTDASEMQKFVQDYNLATGSSKRMQDLFRWDELSRTYKLTNEGMEAYLANRRAELEGIEGIDQSIIDNLIESERRDALLDQIDIDSFLSATERTPEMRQQMVDAFRAYYQADMKNGQFIPPEAIDEMAENAVAALETGGAEAVAQARQVAEWKNEDFGFDQIQAAYRSGITGLTESYDMLSAGIGEVVSGEAAAILSEAGYGLTIIDESGAAVVTSIGDVTEAYRSYYDTLVESGEATTSEINAAAAQILANRDGEQQIIDALSDASGMTYDRFGEILDQAGIQLGEALFDQWAEQGIVEAVGGNKMRITNFGAFADQMGWEAGSEEYISAFRAYNDSMIELNQKTEDNIKEEVFNLLEAKPGDQVNLTSTMMELSDGAAALIEQQIKAYGGQIEDGILTITEDTNIIGIAQSITTIAAEEGALLTDSVAELADAVLEAIQSFADALTNGIEGKLSNQDAADLTNFARTNLGIDLVDADFSRTEEGLELSREKAFELYQALKQIDGFSAAPVLDGLVESLSKAGSGLETFEKSTIRIRELEEEIAKVNAEIREGQGKNDPEWVEIENEKLDRLNAELATVREIQAEQANNPDNFNFMDRDLPDSFQGAENFWNSGLAAYKAMNESAQSGYMSIQDFYNIANQMQDMAVMSGQDLMFMGQTIYADGTGAAELIESAFSHLTAIDGEGVKIALGDLGADISAGADSMSSGFDTGLKSVAQAQIQMLDAAINILETIVAMENIDVDNDGFLSLDELFQVDGKGNVTDFTQQTDAWLRQVESSCGNIEIGGRSLRDALLDLAKVDPQKAVDLMNQLYLIDWTLGDTNVFGQIQNVLSTFFVGQEITQGPSIFDVLKVPKNAARDSQEFKTWLDNIKVSEEDANRVLDLMTRGGNIGSIDSNNVTVLEKIMQLSEQQRQAFEQFGGANGSIDMEEVKMWSQIQLIEDAQGNITGGTYTDSNGGTHELGKDPSSWKSQIEGFEQEARKTSIMGDAAVGASLENSNIETVTMDNGVTVEGVVEATDDGYNAYYNGQTSHCETPEEAKQWILDQANKSLEGGSKLTGVSETGELEYQTYYKITGQVNAESATDFATKSREQIQQIIDNAVKGPNGEFTINGITFNPGTTAAEVQAAFNEVTNNSDMFSSLPNRIADGIQQAFTGSGGAAIAAAIGLGVRAGLTGEQLNLDEVGTMVDTGLANGIQIGGLAVSAAETKGTDVINAIKTALGVQSPSVYADEAGQNVDAGLAQGITSGTASVTAATTLGTQVITALQTALDATEWNLDIASALGTIADMTIDGVDASHYDSTLTLTEDIAQGQANITNLTVGATNLTASTGLASLQTMDFSTTSQGLLSIQTRTKNIGSQSFSNFAGLSSQLSTISSQVSTIWSTVQQFANQTFTVTLNEVHTGGDSTTNQTVNQTTNQTVNVDTSAAVAACAALSSAASSCAGPVTVATGRIRNLSSAIGTLPNKAGVVTALATAMNRLPSVSSRVSGLASAMSNIPNVASRISALNSALSKIPSSKTISISARVSVTATGATVKGQTPSKNTSIKIAGATGNVALAKGRKTLMGELGPELVVSNGKYFIVGENGPEMVNLAEDAIVFNHKQTEDLLKRGRTSRRGDPVTNENNAISLATGNVGPAMASASAALAALKQLRAMWQSMLDASAKDLGSQAGRGGGGGGGGGGGDDETVTEQNVVEDIERWYNLLRQIEKIEEQISYQESLQEKYQSDRLANGYKLYDSYQQELELLDAEIDRNKRLAELQKSWYDNKRKELEASTYGKIFTYDDEGLMQYVDGPGRGLDILENLTRRDVTGQAIDNAKTAATQLSYLKSLGFDIGSLIYNDDGTFAAKYDKKGRLVSADKGEVLSGQELADAQTQMMENFWANVDGWRDELDSLYDSYHEQQEKIIENQTKQNEILQELIDNQISVEEDIMKAIEAREQAEIDRLTEEKEALQDSMDKFVNGLTEQLNREKNMYQNDQNDQELNKLQRQLAILQRSGSSGSQIRKLQEQIDSKQQDIYFQKQQEQIDAIKEASDKQIEKLDAQIDLMSETLEYQKENGLLWQEVRQIMMMQPEEVMSLLQEWDPDYRSKSELQVSEDLRDFKLRFETWVGERERKELDRIFDEMTSKADEKFKSSGFTLDDSIKQAAKEAFNQTWKDTGSKEQAQAAGQKVYDDAYANAAEAKRKADEEAARKKAEEEEAKKQQQAAAAATKPQLSPKQKAEKYGWQIAATIWCVRDDGWGDGAERRNKIEELGMDYGVVQGYVDYLAKYKSSAKKVKEAAGGASRGIGSLADMESKFTYDNFKKLYGFDTGGYTGEWGSNGKLAILHEKELVLNKDDTAKILQAVDYVRKNNMTTSSIDSTLALKSLLSEFSNTMRNTAGWNTYNNMSTDSGVIIEKAEINLAPGTISNDYDARRAGSMIMDEMVKIARKSGNLSLSRR